MIVTNRLSVVSLTRIKDTLDSAAQKYWKIEDFCDLRESVPTSELGSVMIEQFKR